MNSPAQFNALPLLSVKPALDEALDRIGASMERYFADTAENGDALKDAIGELHNAIGVLRMLSLEGVLVFCGELDKLLQDFATGALQPSSIHHEIIQRALLILTHFLGSLTEGAPNATLRLFDPYQELQQARGIEAAFPVDLFFPDLNVDLPADIAGIALATDVQMRAKAARGQYQQALLKWLRQDGVPEALQNMQAAVRTMLACVPASQRAFWWVALGLIDCMIFDGLPPELSATKLLGRIDLGMKALGEGKTPDYQASLNEMLYLVGSSHAVSEIVEDIKQRYALDSYLPEESPLPPGETAQVLERMRGELDALEEAWDRCSMNDEVACAALAGQTASLQALSDQLSRNTLQVLCRYIHGAASAVTDAEFRQRIRMDMALALVLLEAGIANYTRLADSFHEQVRILGPRLQHVPTEMPDVKELAPLYCQMAQREILPLLVEAMAGNLDKVEQELNAFFATQEKSEDLALQVRLLNQVQGCLYMLELPEAAQLTESVKSTVSRYAEGARTEPEEMRVAATAISALGVYIHDLTSGQKPDNTVLQEMLAAVAPRQAPAEAASVSTGAVEAVEAVEEMAPEDNEMLEVFLEEAQEVLSGLRENLGISQLHPESLEPLATIRRAFHTLKGSGRMVGLNDLGEVAWAVERAMNKWLKENKPATPGLLQFIADAETLFQSWVDALRTHSGVSINAEPLVEAAQQVERGEEPAVQEAAIPAESLGLEQLAEAMSEETAQAEEAAVMQPEHKADLPFSLDTLLPASLDVSSEAPQSAAPAVPDMDEIMPEIGQSATPAPLPEAATPAEAPAQPQVTRAAEYEEETDTVTVGTITLPSTLFDIASEECASNLAKLQEFLAELRTSSAPVFSYDFMRAAHTLAGVNRTMGFVAVADLSRALELWVNARIGKAVALRPEQIDMVEETIATLDAMFLDICNHQEPQPQPELIARLHADQEGTSAAELRAESAPAEVSPPNVEAPSLQEELKKEVWGAATAAKFTAISEAASQPEAAKPAAATPAQAVLSQPVPGPQPASASPVSATAARPVIPAASLETTQTRPAAVQPAKKPTVETTQTRPGAAAPAKKPSVETTQTRVSAEGETRVRQYVEERTVKDEVDDQLLPIFLEESGDLQPRAGTSLRAWRADPDDMRQANELQRILHTLKGGARMAGVMRLGELIHRMEDRVVTGMSKALRTEALWDELDNYFDRISHALERLRSGEGEEVQAAPATPGAETAAAEPSAAAAESTVQARTEPAERAATMLRVRSETVDRLVNEAGEISVARSRMEAELRAFKTSLTDMTESVLSLRRQLREIEIQAESQMEARVALAKDLAEKFDPLEFDRFTRFQELTRFMGESVHDIQTVQQSLLKNVDETSAAMSAQAYLNRELQQSLMSIRMVPFSGISDRLYRVVRQTAKELNKRANLDLRGTEVEIDRSVLDRMTGPFEHILRNAIAHGLEEPDERNRKGKPAIGQIQIALTQESNEVVFEVSDDGGGINLDALRRKAVEYGLFRPGAPISDEEAVQLIFNSGMSTASQITEIAGRGVGMDVVRNEITSLGGQISVRSERGKGTRFIIRLPLTLAVTQVLMTRAGQSQYAVPSVMVEQVLYLKPDALEEAHRAGHIEWKGRHYPLNYLPRLLGDEKVLPESRMNNSILLLHSAEQRIALLVDELLGNQETVVKNIGPQLSRMPGIAGATVLGNGKVVLILNPVALAQPAVIGRKETGVPIVQVVEPEPPPSEQPLQTIPLVMVVDDSLTVRKVTSRMLARAGYDVATAKDGVDALEQLTQINPDVMLLDVEMPRMDGFELTRQIRRDPRLHDLPILMITSRTAEKHREHALELGVNAYFGKPFQEEELMEQINKYVKQPGR